MLTEFLNTSKILALIEVEILFLAAASQEKIAMDSRKQLPKTILNNTRITIKILGT